MHRSLCKLRIRLGIEVTTSERHSLSFCNLLWTDLTAHKISRCTADGLLNGSFLNIPAIIEFIETAVSLPLSEGRAATLQCPALQPLSRTCIYIAPHHLILFFWSQGQEQVRINRFNLWRRDLHGTIGQNGTRPRECFLFPVHNSYKMQPKAQRYTVLLKDG